MDFDSPDVEKDFPGLYASESKKDDDDCTYKRKTKIPLYYVFFILNIFTVSEGLLLGRRKDKKDKKDRGYAALDGESSPEEDLETKYAHILNRKPENR